MDKRSFIAVFLFVGISILMAAAYHHWQLAQKPTTDGESTKSGNASITDQLRQIVERGQKAQRRLAQNEEQSVIEARKCQCVRAPATSGFFQLNSEGDCSTSSGASASNYERFPPVFRDQRARAPTEFPRICMTYLLHLQENKPKRGLASESCATPCVTESVVNSHHNLFGDVTSCLGIPQKEFLPQFQQIPLQAKMPGVAQAWPMMRERILQSEDESCKRLQPYIKKMSSLDVEKKCDSVEQPLAPYLAFAIRYEQNLIAVRQAMAKNQLSTLFTQAMGSDVEPEQVEQMLVTLGFELGPISSVLYLKNYLLSQIQEGRAAELKSQDFKFFEWNEGQTTKTLSFPAYVAQYQSTGNLEVIRALLKNWKSLNLAFREGTCGPESFLSLSQ